VGTFRGVELDDLVLSGPRLVLRPWAAADAPRVVEAMGQPATRRFLALPEPYTRADADRYIGDFAIPARLEGRGLECAVVERATGRIVGSAALRLPGDAEIGYWVAGDAQGNGYAAEATAVLADWAFGTGVPRVRLAAAVDNLPSIRTALAAGFRFEGVARDGHLGGGTGGVPELRADLARFARLAGDRPGRQPYVFPPLPASGLSDGTLRLRPARAEDAPAMVETDDELTLRWNFTGETHPPDEVRRQCAQAGLMWLVGSVALFAMVDEATGRVAGSLRLRQAGPPQVGGVGYVVHPEFRGRGYTARALRLVVPWAFEVADFARLELGAKVGNEASLRAAAAAGFEPDGVRQARLRNADGSFSDEVRYALINPKYR
jgi:RimJ/RimL family protein N-acetyltransferase